MSRRGTVRGASETYNELGRMMVGRRESRADILHDEQVYRPASLKEEQDRWYFKGANTLLVLLKRPLRVSTE